jgi:hypothetical protein
MDRAASVFTSLYFVPMACLLRTSNTLKIPSTKIELAFSNVLAQILSEPWIFSQGPGVADFLFVIPDWLC